ncbi:obscurin-like isoform X4 [Penaeus vannamei]
MQTIPQRATDAKFISSIEGFKGNLFKLGRLLRHDWFSVKEAGQKARDRYLFLFKARILITKVKRISEDRSIFILKDIIRLPETSLGSLDNPRAIEFFHIESLTHPNYPIFIEARTPEIREAWLSGIGEYVVDTASVEDLLFDDELRVVSQDVDEDDAGVVSPVPEVQEFEDLPEDGEAAEALQGQEDFWAREPSPPAKRQKPEAVPEETAEVDFWAQKESTPPRRQPVPGLAPAAEAAPEQVEESTPVAEQEKASAEQASFIPQEPSPSAQQDTIEDIWAKRETSPPFKKTKTTDTVQEEHTFEQIQESLAISAGAIVAETKVRDESESPIDIWGSREPSPAGRKDKVEVEEEEDLEDEFHDTEEDEAALIERWFDNETDVQKEIKTEASREQTIVVQQEDIIDIWGSSSPPLRPRAQVPFIDEGEEKQQEESPDEELIERWFDTEEQASGDKILSEAVDKEAERAHLSAEETESPPPKKPKIDETQLHISGPSSSESPVQEKPVATSEYDEATLEDFWAKCDSPPPRPKLQVIDESTPSPPKSPVEEKVDKKESPPKSPVKEEPSPVEAEEAFVEDFFAGRESPLARPKPVLQPEEVSETVPSPPKSPVKEEPSPVEAEEASVEDFFAGRESPLARPKPVLQPEEVRETIPSPPKSPVKEEPSPVEAEEASVEDFFAGRESPLARPKPVLQPEEVRETVPSPPKSPVKEEPSPVEAEEASIEDFFAGRESPLARPKPVLQPEEVRETVPSPPKSPVKEEPSPVEAEEASIEDFFAGRESPLARPKPVLQPEEVRETVPSPSKSPVKEEPSPVEAEEASIEDFFAGRESSLARPKPVLQPEEVRETVLSPPKSPVKEEPSPVEAEEASIEDFFAGRESPLARPKPVLQPEEVSETVPSPPKSPVKEEPSPVEAEEASVEDFFAGRESPLARPKPVLQPEEVRETIPSPPKSPVKEEPSHVEAEEAFVEDFFAGRESPLARPKPVLQPEEVRETVPSPSKSPVKEEPSPVEAEEASIEDFFAGRESPLARPKPVLQPEEVRETIPSPPKSPVKEEPSPVEAEEASIEDFFAGRESPLARPKPVLQPEEVRETVLSPPKSPVKEEPSPVEVEEASIEDFFAGRESPLARPKPVLQPEEVSETVPSPPKSPVKEEPSPVEAEEASIEDFFAGRESPLARPKPVLQPEEVRETVPSPPKSPVKEEPSPVEAEEASIEDFFAGRESPLARPKPVLQPEEVRETVPSPPKSPVKEEPSPVEAEEASIEDFFAGRESPLARPKPVLQPEEVRETIPSPPKSPVKEEPSPVEAEEASIEDFFAGRESPLARPKPVLQPEEVRVTVLSPPKSPVKEEPSPVEAEEASIEDFFAGRESPLARPKPVLQPEEVSETVPSPPKSPVKEEPSPVEAEEASVEDFFAGRESPLARPKPVLQPEEVSETVPSPPKSPVKEEPSPVEAEEASIEDFFAGRESPLARPKPVLQPEEVREIVPSPPKSPVKEEPSPVEAEEASIEDFFAGRESPLARPKPVLQPEEVSETVPSPPKSPVKEEPSPVEAEEASIEDFFAGRESPLARPKPVLQPEEVREIVPSPPKSPVKEEPSPVEAEEASIEDFFAGRESPLARPKPVLLLEEVSEAVPSPPKSPVKEFDETALDDFWSGRESPLSRPQPKLHIEDLEATESSQKSPLRTPTDIEPTLSLQVEEDSISKTSRDSDEVVQLFEELAEESKGNGELVDFWSTHDISTPKPQSQLEKEVSEEEREVLEYELETTTILSKDVHEVIRLSKEIEKVEKTVTEVSVEEISEFIAPAVVEEDLSKDLTPKEKPEPSKPAEAKPESPKPAKVKPEPPKPAEVKRELPKPAEVKPEPPKPAEVKPEPPKPAEVKPEPPKPAEVKPEPPKPAEVKPEPPKPAEVKPEPPKPAEVKPEPPKPAEVKPEPPEPAEVSKQEPPKPQVQTRAPLAKLAAPAPHKMQEPTTPFTPGGTPKPVFTKTLKGDVVEPGDGVTFVCEVAHPAPYFITWLKDSKPLDDKLADRVQQTDTGAKHALKMTDEGCKHTLQVLNCRVEDSGIYTAKATDENGVWSTCSAQLLVQELTEEERARRIAEKSPFFMVRMKPTQVIENTNLSYTIHVKGDPMPNVTFFKDDKELKEDARVTIHRDAAIGHYELLITHVQREDEGTYKCVATNKFGKAECEASMAVTDEEMLYESLSGKGSLLAKGEKAEFKWFRDGVEFDPHERFNVMFKDDEDTLALVFQNVTPEDAGLYTCVASTSCGKISCSAELTVEGSINRLQRDPEPPNFKEELTDTQVNVGGSAMLECRIGGYPKPELAWTRNGLDVKAGGRIKFLWEDEESVALIIKNCEEKDAGLYRVIAKNELGEVSCSAKLGIKAGPKIVSMKKEVACVVGQKLDYRVEVEGEPTPEIRWLKDGKQLMESDHIKFTKESDTVFVFKIDSMQMDDCCTYTVVASNPMGQVSEFFTIATDAAPQITRGLDPEIEKRYTYDIALEVRGTGSPKPMARWYKNGKEIMADDRFKMVVDESFYILKIRRLERKDKGTYCCELSNSSGTAKSEGVLSVRAPPDFVTPLKDACAKEGGKDVKMFVEWEANPMPTVKWFFNDKPIRDDTPGYTIRGQDTSMVLTIHEATEDVVGTYSVTATNEYGESVCKARFRLHEAPVVTEGLKDAEFLEDNSAKFTFKATGVPTPEIKWTKDGKKWSPDMHRVKLKQEGDDTFTLYFDEAKTEDSGHYVATISNVEGTVSTEASIVVNTDGRSSIAVAKCSKGAANDSGIHEQTVVDGGSLGEGKGLTGSASEASEGGSEKETVDASNKRKLITQEPVKVNKAKRGKKEVTVPDDLEIGNTENSQSCKKDAMVYKFTDVETETKIEDDQEKTVSKSVDMTVYDEIMQVEAEDSDESEENSTLIVRGFLEGTSSSEVPRGGLRVLASCSIHRQENVQKTVITAETDVGDDNVATSSIVHLKRTVDIENYKALVSESESDSESESRTLEKRDSRCALLLTKTPSVTVEEVPPAAGEALEAERGRAGPETDVNWNVIPETRSQRCLVDRDVPPVGEDADAVSKALDLAKSANSETADASSVLDEGKEKPGEAGLPRDAKAKKAKHERLSTGPLDASGAPPHIKGSNFRDGKTFIAMHKFVLEVEATAVPEAEATWYFNDKILSVEEDSVKFSFEGNKYTMERIGSDPEHSGQYKCVLKNKIKEVEEVGQVTVIEKEARVRRPLEDIYVKENTDATLKCQIVGDPIPSVEWLRNGKPLPPSERYEVSEERMKGWHTLVLKEVTEQDKSTFTVKGKNKHGECETSARLGVLVRPQPGELNDATVDYGKDLLLNVAIHAFPPPKMVWTLDGRELQEGDHYEYTRDEEKEVYGLLVHSAVLEDAGKITFTASNAAGSESGSCTVKVHTEKPAIVADLEDLSYCLEDDAVFTLRASGLPLPDVEWKLHDKVVKADERHVFTNPEPGVYCMTIKDVCMNDYGPVAVVAKSLVGECASAAKFSQKKIPCEVVEGLENVTKGAEGDDVTLTVKIRASPRPNFVWTKDSDICEASEKIVIEMKKTSYCEATISLTLVEASSIDSGQYRLKFQNELNEESTETALIVRPERRKPKITKPPKELQVLERKRGIFQAKVTGFPKPEVKWMKDGRQIYPTDIIDTGVTGDGFQYLEFKTVTMEDVGQYTIFASNEEGTAEAHAALIVVPPPSKPEFLQSLKASKVILGYPARMEVKLGGYPMPEVQWLKDGQPLNIDGTHYKQIVEPDGTVILQIDAATEGDMGEITCVAKNPEGDSQSSATLSVLGFKREDGQPDGPAAFTEGLKDMCFDEGMVMRLPVAMKGGPVPNMKWYKDGQEIKLDDRCFFTYDGDRTYLEIRPCKGSDSGMYKCVIQNSHGSAETECEVSIRKCYEAPFFTNTFTRMDKLPGSEVKMSVRYDGVPKPELSWFHNGEPILHDGDKYRIRKDGDGQTLTVKELTYSDSGAWKVVAKNREGETEHEAELNVSDDVDPNRRIEAPVFMKVIGDQELFEGYNALFKAVVSGKPEPEFKWLKNGGTIVASNRVIMERDPEGLIRLTIKRITPEDAGQYTLKVWNDYGEASCHGKLICETLTSRKKRPVGDEYKGFDRIRRSGVPMPLPEKPMISALADRRLTLSWMPHLAAPQTMPCTYQVEMCDAPDGDWFTVRTGIRGCSVDITNLMPKGDYKFRVRVANKYGVSEPSPYVATQRFKLELPAIRYEPQMDPNYEYKGDGPYVPEGFRISRDSLGNYFAAPRFLRLPHDTQYGLKGFNANIKWYAYGYPTPKVRFLKNGQPLEVGDKTRFKYSQEVTGEICLYIDRMTEADVGTYECLVRNEHGESRQRIKMDICEYPRVLEPLEEIHLKANSSGKIACRITGFPPCQVQWFRDWEPIAFTYKLRPAQSDPDLYFLHISGCQIKDSGLYSVAASNVAGTVHSSCMVHVEADDIGFFWMGPGSGRSVTMNNRRGTLEDHYDVGDELGRGTQGVVYHCVEHHTGRNFAAKSMWGKDQFKTWMQNEFEMMNALNSCKQIVRLYDAYEGPKNMVLVTELCGGGDLLGTLTQHQYLTEYEVCHYVRQILCALEYMHDRCIAHLGLNVGDILLTRPNGIEIKIGDLSLARNIRISKVAPLDYGMPEFVAPEVANGEGVTYAADMWSLGIITYLLLSGTSPFRGENDRETLTRVKKGEMSFDMEAFRHISDEAKDFIAKLLLFKPDVRMNVKDALVHPWIKKCLDPPGDAYKINTDRLKSYYAKFRDWYSNASCKRWFRRRTLASCFTHPSKMVYPPGEVYTSPESPERDIVPAEPEDYHVPHRKYSYELGLIKNESHYQMGPDTYLLQLRDVDFPCRLRSYMKVATDRSPAFAMSMRENDYDYTVSPSPSQEAVWGYRN